MDYYNMEPVLVPLGPVIGLIAKVVWLSFTFLVAYILGHFSMRGLAWLMRRRY